MNLSYRNKIFIDHTLGTVAALFLKAVSRIPAIILRRDHSIPVSPKCIVVAKLVGLGSIVYAGSLCRSLKERYPESKLVFITGIECGELVNRFNGVDQVLCLDARSFFSILKSSTRIIMSMWRYRPDLYFDLEVYSSFSAILATLSLAINRYGFYRKSAAFKRNLHTHMIFFNTRRHIIEIYNQLGKCVKANELKNIRNVYRVADEDRDECAALFSKMGLSDRRLMLVNMNASELLLERRWPSENWRELLVKLAERFPAYLILLTGSSTERSFVASIYGSLPEEVRVKVHNVAGNLSLGGFLGLINCSDVLITNDSGPLHLAVAQGKPTVSLWGPGSPEGYGPREGNHEVIYTQTYCSPCLYHAEFPPCEGDNACMKRTTVQSVFDAVERILQKKTWDGIGNQSEDDDEGINFVCNHLADYSPVMFHKKYENMGS
jgi:ADP-heptose:LPS heptosyltransferase